MITPIELSASQTITVGIVADTHIPDRVNALHPDLLNQLKIHQVDYIFHAGDVSIPRVLDELGAVAPVYAVAGNRDILHRHQLPIHQRFLINNIRVLLTHGHVDPFHYWFDKFQYVLQGYRMDRYVRRLEKLAQDTDVIIFGHTHRAENREIRGKLFHNPGSVSIAIRPEIRISFGIIKFAPSGRATGATIDLTGHKVRFGKWVTDD